MLLRRYLLLLLSAMTLVLELFRGIRLILWGIQDEHTQSITRGLLITFNGIFFAALTVLQLFNICA